MAFYDINDDMELAEEFVKYLVQYALDHCMDDLLNSGSTWTIE